MPEGDTVWLAAKRMHEALAGRVLCTTDFRILRYATADLAGQAVVEVVPRGKHMLTRTDAGLTLHTHLEMDGSWRLFRAGARWTGGPGHQIRVVLGNDEWTAVGYRMHDVEILPTSEETTLVGHLGPDTCGPDWDPDEAVRRLAARPDREAGPALLDQRNLAGIGNLYKNEALFLRGITPWTPVGEIADLRALVTLAQRLIAANRPHPQQTTTGVDRPGERQWVYERAGRPCRRCGAPIRMAHQAEPDHPERARSSYWCPNCQAGPVVLAAARSS